MIYGLNTAFATKDSLKIGDTIWVMVEALIDKESVKSTVEEYTVVKVNKQSFELKTKRNKNYTVMHDLHSGQPLHPARNLRYHVYHTYEEYKVEANQKQAILDRKQVHNLIQKIDDSDLKYVKETIDTLLMTYAKKKHNDKTTALINQTINDSGFDQWGIRKTVDYKGYTFTVGPKDLESYGSLKIYIVTPIGYINELPKIKGFRRNAVKQEYTTQEYSHDKVLQRFLTEFDAIINTPENTLYHNKPTQEEPSE